MANNVLDNLDESPLADLDSLSEEFTSDTQPGNPAISKNMAAYAAMLDPKGDQVNTYRSILAEIGDTGSSPLAESILAQAKTESFASTKSAFIEFLNNPNFSDEEKRAAAAQVLDVESDRFNSRNTFSFKSLVSDSKGETKEAEDARLNLGNVIEEINEYKRQVHYLYNSEVSKLDKRSGFENYLGAVELILPFTETLRTSQLADDFRAAGLSGEGDQRGVVRRLFTALGENKKELHDALDRMPPEKKMEVAQKLVDLINTSETTLLPDENDIAKIEQLKTVLLEGSFGTSERIVGDIVSVLDIIALGGLLKKPITKLSKSFTRYNISLEDLERAWNSRFTKTATKPTSVAENLKDTNPEQARLTHEAARADETGEAADVLYGTTREDAIANDILPEIATTSGVVKNKTTNPGSIADQVGTPDPKIMDAAAKDGAIYYFEEEKRQMRARVFNDFNNAIGMRIRSEMSQFGAASEGGSVIRAVYGASEGGYTSASDAFNMAKFSLRQYGVKDDEIKLLVRDSSGEYVPISGIPTEPGDYLVQVDYTYKFNPLDVQKWAEADVKYNIFDQMRLFTGEGKAGTLQRHLLDAHSMLHPNITLGANVSVDRAAGLEAALLDLGKSFADIYKKMPAARAEAMEHYIKEANYRGIPLDEARLATQGFTGEEIGALKKWRGYWDTIYWLENKDLAQTFRNKGIQLLEDARSDTRLFVKPLSPHSAKSVRQVYDMETGLVKNLDSNQFKAIEEGDLIVAELKSPLQDGEDLVKHILVREKMGGSYLRGIRDTDKILNYRQGYYSVNYKAPKFIQKTITNSRGEVVISRAVAVAGDTPTAELYRSRLQKEAPEGVTYTIRSDNKKMRMDSDDYWNLQESGGRSSQRLRGDRLEDASNLNVLGSDNSFIMGPVQSMVHAARSTAARVSMRDMISATEERFLQQFSDTLAHDKGRPVYPSRIDQIGRAGQRSGKHVGDAITTWEYINYLKKGYENTIDEGVKRTLSFMADFLGRQGHGTTEAMLNRLADGRGVTGFGKNLAFQAYLALNPLRQFVVQGHQATLLTANFPKYVLSQQLARDTGGVLMGLMGKPFMNKAAQFSGRSEKELEEIIEQFKSSGLQASIDKQNLISGSLTQMAEDSSFTSRTAAARALGKAVRFSRKAGFDSGELMNILTSWLAHRDQAVKQLGKKTLNQEDLDLITGKARNYTGNMNFAGDMPYNQNALNIPFHFVQVPHKLGLLYLSNRVLTRAEKMRWLGFQFLMYAPPVPVTYGLYNLVGAPENPELKELITNRIEGYMLNKAMSLMAGEEVRLDWSSLSPSDMYGTLSILEALATSDIGTLYSNSPFGKLTSGRIFPAFKTAARYFNLIDDYEDPTSFSQVSRDFLKISSGFSNAFKARYTYQYGQKIHGFDVIDDNIPSIVAFAQAAGFNTMEEAETWYFRKKLYGETKEFEEDVKNWYKELSRHFEGKGITPQSEGQMSKVFSEAFRVFSENEPRARKIIYDLWRRDMKSNNHVIAQGLIKSVGIMSASEIETLLDSLPELTPEQRQQYKDIVKGIAAQQEFNIED